MNKVISLILLSSALLLAQTSFCQTKGKNSTQPKNTVKKVMPEQVYGNPRAQRRADSIANALRMEEEAKARQLAEEEMLRKQQDAEQKKLRSTKSKSTSYEAKRKREEAPKPVRESIPVKTPALKREYAQEPVKMQPKTNAWMLNECVEYARINNLQVKETELNERMAKLNYEQNKASRLPNVNGDMNLGESFGRSIDPTSNQFVTKGFTYNTLGVSSQVLLFGWFQKKHQIEQSKYDIESANYAFKQIQDDVSLNVATGFLRVLLAREQVKINEAQLKLDNEQLLQTKRLVSAGKLPELNTSQMLAQLSSDSAVWISSITDERIALLQLRALMNFSFEDIFDIAAPNLDMLKVAELRMLESPEAIFNTAIQQQNRMKFNQTKLLSAKKSLDIAKAQQYPQLSFFANLGTNFSSNIKDITGQTYLGEVPLGNINIAGTSYPLTRPDYAYSTKTRGLFNQYGDNIRLNGGFALSMPIFNAYSARTNIQKAKIGLVSQQIAMDNDMQRLKQDIYTAYEQAKAASQKFASAKRAEEASQRALDFAVKRYNAGLINTYEYTSSLNTLYAASTRTLSAKYDLIFKLKVLDYYMGNPLKL
jgi:outer membrane protein